MVGIAGGFVEGYVIVMGGAGIRIGNGIAITERAAVITTTTTTIGDPISTLGRRAIGAIAVIVAEGSAIVAVFAAVASSVAEGRCVVEVSGEVAVDAVGVERRCGDGLRA